MVISLSIQGSLELVHISFGTGYTLTMKPGSLSSNKKTVQALSYQNIHGGWGGHLKTICVISIIF